MLDRNGHPKIFYHGTKSDFTIFDKSKLDDRFGFFFTENVNEAKDYGEPHEYYLNVRNPIDIYSDEYYEKYYGIKNTDERVNQNPVLIEANVLGKLYAVNAKK